MQRSFISIRIPRVCRFWWQTTLNKANCTWYCLAFWNGGRVTWRWYKNNCFIFILFICLFFTFVYLFIHILYIYLSVYLVILPKKGFFVNNNMDIMSRYMIVIRDVISFSHCQLFTVDLNITLWLKYIYAIPRLTVTPIMTIKYGEV